MAERETNYKSNGLPYLELNETRRMYYLLNEIDNLFIAIHNELANEKPYKYYIQEKMKGIVTDINCILSLIDDIKEE